jgi:uncharacterized membrane protein (GlpM family)
VALYGILLAIIDIVLFNYLIGMYRTDAAKIQEEFDCSVYDLEWDNISVGKKVVPEVINKFASRYVHDDRFPLTDWYPQEIENLSHLNSILVCQKTNLYYDSSLRLKYKATGIIVACITFIILIIVSLSSNLTLRNFFIQVLLPFLPVFVLTMKIIVDHTKSIKASRELHQTINSYFDLHNLPSYNELRKIQDKIYCHRKDSPLIPDFFYNKKREGLENEMHENASL